MTMDSRCKDCAWRKSSMPCDGETEESAADIELDCFNSDVEEWNGDPIYNAGYAYASGYPD